MAEGSNGKEKSGRCPNCGAPTELRYRPFCSRRCAELDLGNWLNESYRVPVVEDEEFPDDEDEVSED